MGIALVGMKVEPTKEEKRAEQKRKREIVEKARKEMRLPKASE